MDRRSFLLRGSCSLATLALSRRAFGRGTSARSNPDQLRSLSTRALQRIGFGSCNRSTLPQTHWDIIGRDNPDLWIWLGDNIYADRATMDERNDLYQNLLLDPYYSKFRGQVPVIGVWDDHDFARDNADGSFGEKEASKEAVLGFLEVARDHEVWGHSGIYQSYVFGPKGKQTQIFMLDLRFNMDRHRQQKTLLGEAQWAWFESELRASTSDLLVIGSSLNMSSTVTGFGMEGWNGFGADKKRLLALLAEIGKPAVILSGDRHFAELYQIILPNGLRIYEAMSSGLTHSTGVKLPHSGRIGDMVGRKNYGLLDIDWAGTIPQVRMAICSAEKTQTYQEHWTKFAIESP